MDVQALIEQVEDPWYNQTLVQVGEVLVRLGVMQGEFHWHTHDEQDEFFFVLDGLFRIELDGAETVELGPGKHSRFRPGCCIGQWFRCAAPS